MNRKEIERAVEITDRIRRHRFYKTLPMEACVLSLRWILEGPEELLSKQALQQRQLPNKYPNYQHNRQVLDQLLTESFRSAIMPDRKPPMPGSNSKRSLTLSQGTVAQETYLQRMALEPNPTEFSFPPLYNMKFSRLSCPWIKL